MPVLCCGSSSVQVDQPGTKPTNKNDPGDNENNNTKESREDEVADNQEYAHASPGHSNGLMKSSPHKMKYEVNPDPDTTATSAVSASNNDNSSAAVSRKAGGVRKLPAKKNRDSADAGEEAEGYHSAENLGERSTPPKKKSAKKSSFRDAEEMEMSPLDPGFYNSATLQATRQLYSQQTFEEEEDEFLDSMEEERRKNKQRQRMKKKHAGSAAAPPPPGLDTMQAAYERAQQEIDKVLGPRHHSNIAAMSGGAGSEKSRSKRRSRRGQGSHQNKAYRDDDDATASAVAALQPLPPSESLEEMKSRVHALLDDAFSLLSGSYTSMGNRVAPASPSKPSSSESPDAVPSESAPPLARALPEANMPAVEQVPDSSAFAPRPGEKLHTPVLVDRSYGDYDADGLITWSPYRAADDTARIVLPESQPSSSIKAPTQEKLQTTTFVGSALGGTPHHNHPASSSQPVIIRTRQPPPIYSSPLPTTTPTNQLKEGQRQHSRMDHALGKGPSSSTFGATADSEYTPYPGLEAYEDMLAKDTTSTTTTTAVFTTVSSKDENPLRNGGAGESSDTASQSEPPPAHIPPTRNVGTRDARDIISSSVGTGTSAKELVDSIREELKSLSEKLSSAQKEEGLSNGGAHHSEKLSSDSATAAVDQKHGVSSRNAKPLKKPRKSSYLDLS